MGDDDRDLVRAALAGEARAFEVLLDRYKARIFSYVLRLVKNRADAEDLTQETFIKAFKGLASYDPSRPLISWLFRIAHNSVVDLSRKQRTTTVSLDADENPPEIEDGSLSLEAAAEKRSDEELVERLLRALPEIYREVMILRHKEGLEVAEIARIAQVPVGTVKARLFRAREALQELYKRMQPPGGDRRTL